MTRNSDIPPGWKLPEEITARLGSKTGKQRVIAESDHILIVLHTPPQKNDSGRDSVFLWRNAEGTWDSNERGHGMSALDDYLNNYEKLEDSLDEAYDQAIKADDFFNLLEQITPIQRAIKNTSRTLQEARELVGEELIDARDRADELNRSFELLYLDCKNGLDYAVAKKAEEQSAMQRQALIAGHRLNITMALFLPVTAVASLLGMNIPHGLESAPSWVFFSIVVTCAFLGLFMKYVVLRKADEDDKE